MAGDRGDSLGSHPRRQRVLGMGPACVSGLSGAGQDHGLVLGQGQFRLTHRADDCFFPCIFGIL